MDRLVKDNGNMITDQQEMLKEQVLFFKDRYSKKVDFKEELVEEFLEGVEVPQLTEDQKIIIEGLISETEMSIALTRMKNGSSPGCEGITTGFMKFFGSKIKCMVMKSLNAAYVNGELSYTQKRGIMTLNHKGKQLQRDDLNNWHPISLTNTDYKLLAKCIALRLSSVILSVINEDQVGFLKGRNMCTVIRVIDDLINYMDIKQKPGVLVALDYKAAFDTISKDFVLYAFKRFNFGDVFCQMD